MKKNSWTTHEHGLDRHFEVVPEFISSSSRLNFELLQVISECNNVCLSNWFARKESRQLVLQLLAHSCLVVFEMNHHGSIHPLRIKRCWQIWHVIWCSFHEFWNSWCLGRRSLWRQSLGCRALRRALRRHSRRLWICCARPNKPLHTVTCVNWNGFNHFCYTWLLHLN